MTQNEFMKFFDTDMAKNFAGFGALPFDFKALMEAQRRNFEAFSAAQQHTLEALQEISQRQGEILSEMVESNSSITQEIMGEGSPEQKVAKQADLMKKMYEQSIANLQEIGEIVSRSNQKTGDIINKRVSASLTEFKSAMEKTAPKAATKKAA